MKYLKQFNCQLKNVRDRKNLSYRDVGEYCLVDPLVVESWEAESVEQRCYPSLDNLLDLCFKTGVALECFVDMPTVVNTDQLDLPGLDVFDNKEAEDLGASLSELGKQIEKLIPSDDEQELLRRYRKSDKQSKELILQLIAN